MDNLLGEFMGTMVLMVFGCGVNANMTLAKCYGRGGGWICTTTGWCFAVVMGVYTSVALGAPQADINPSVTIAKTLAYTLNIPIKAISSLEMYAISNNTKKDKIVIIRDIKGVFAGEFD